MQETIGCPDCAFAKTDSVIVFLETFCDKIKQSNTVTESDVNFKLRGACGAFDTTSTQRAIRFARGRKTPGRNHPIATACGVDLRRHLAALPPRSGRRAPIPHHRQYPCDSIQISCWQLSDSLADSPTKRLRPLNHIIQLQQKRPFGQERIPWSSDESRLYSPSCASTTP
jgi:hypothetical protein